MNSRSIVSPNDQSVTFVELFFDLVFVFSITQVVSLFHDGFTWITVGQLEVALASVQGADRAKMARDVYSLLHFPMLCGAIAFAAIVESVIEQPTDSLSLASRAALAAGLVLFVGGMAVAVWRANRHILRSRMAIVIATGVTILVIETTSAITFGIALAGLMLIAIVEERSG